MFSAFRSTLAERKKIRRYFRDLIAGDTVGIVISADDMLLLVAVWHPHTVYTASQLRGLFPDGGERVFFFPVRTVLVVLSSIPPRNKAKGGDSGGHPSGIFDLWDAGAPGGARGAPGLRDITFSVTQVSPG